MSGNFARHEQFLRIFSLLDVLSEARQPLDDQTLISTLRERLGLSRLSPRTLRRDCEFLASCGYPVDHQPIAGSRKFGWQLAKNHVGSRPLPAEPVTLLELVAFALSRDLLRGFEGTVLWTGIEALRHKIERHIPEGLRKQFDEAKRGFLVRLVEPGRYATRPRLLSTLSSAINDRQEIDVDEHGPDGAAPSRHRLQPHCLIIQPPRVQLLAFRSGDHDGAPPVLIDLDRIEHVAATDVMFTPRSFTVDGIVERPS